MQQIDENQLLEQLIGMSRRIAAPEADLVILGEGNTSVKIAEDLFYVKASGTQLLTATRESFVPVSLPMVLGLLQRDQATDEEIGQALQKAVTDSTSTKRPSVETILHAYLLTLPGIKFVAHTHPTAVNTILCSVNAREILKGRIFPDEIVCCGPEPVFVEYVDPGLPLAKAVADACNKYLESHGEPPRSVVMQNHGLIVLGASATQVENASYMWVKTARVLIGAATLGGINYLTPAQVARIYTRPDEKYREKQILSK